MKKIVPLLMAILLFVSCISDDATDTTLVGKWKIIEQLTDPGDGSGTFQPITSDRVIEFFIDGTVTANGAFCYLASGVGDNKTGTYKITETPEVDANFDGEIVSSDCSSNNIKVYFTLPSDGSLILWYQCIEPCGQKFIKL